MRERSVRCQWLGCSVPTWDDDARCQIHKTARATSPTVARGHIGVVAAPVCSSSPASSAPEARTARGAAGRGALDGPGRAGFPLSPLAARTIEPSLPDRYRGELGAPASPLRPSQAKP